MIAKPNPSIPLSQSAASSTSCPPTRYDRQAVKQTFQSWSYRREKKERKKPTRCHDVLPARQSPSQLVTGPVTGFLRQRSALASWGRRRGGPLVRCCRDGQCQGWAWVDGQSSPAHPWNESPYICRYEENPLVNVNLGHICGTAACEGPAGGSSIFP